VGINPSLVQIALRARLFCRQRAIVPHSGRRRWCTEHQPSQGINLAVYLLDMCIVYFVHRQQAEPLLITHSLINWPAAPQACHHCMYCMYCMYMMCIMATIVPSVLYISTYIPTYLHTYTYIHTYIHFGILSGFLQTWIVFLSVCALGCRRKQSTVKADRIPDTPAGACTHI
jgi:hypothetical protein